MNSPWILGISGIGHDLTFALVDPGGVTQFVGEEERFSRVKHGIGALPSCLALDAGLEHCQIRREDIRRIGIGFDAQLVCAGAALSSHLRHESYLLAQWGLDRVEVRRISHHLAHAASGFIPSKFEAAAIVSIDGKGETETTAVYDADDRGIRPLWSKRRHSLGLLYLAITKWLGLGGLGDEGKTMGLAAYGKPTYEDLFRHSLIRSKANGDFHVSPAIVERHYAVGSVEAILGPRRRPDEPLTQERSDVAATMQAIVEEVLLSLCTRARHELGRSALCLVGGVALNAVANGKLIESGLFEDVFIPPWVADCGTAVGAALYVGCEQAGDWQRSGGRLVSPYLGRCVSEAEIRDAIETRDLPADRYDYDDLHEVVAEELRRGSVVGWCRGRAEVGPRSLGTRSILANASIQGMRTIVNERVKFREPWRPFAPSVIAEDVHKYFVRSGSSEFMTVAHPVRPDAADVLSAVTHVDGTARLQKVDRSGNEDYYDLLVAVRAKTGHGVVLNTSLNVRGEPIVSCAEDAVRLFLSTDLDVLVLGDWVVCKRDVRSEALPPVNRPLDEILALAELCDQPLAVVLGPGYLGFCKATGEFSGLRPAVRDLATAGCRVTIYVPEECAGWVDVAAEVGECTLPGGIEHLPLKSEMRAEPALLFVHDETFYGSLPLDVDFLERRLESPPNGGFVLIAHRKLYELRDAWPLVQVARSERRMASGERFCEVAL